MMFKITKKVFLFIKKHLFYVKICIFLQYHLLALWWVNVRSYTYKKDVFEQKQTPASFVCITHYSNLNIIC